MELSADMTTRKGKVSNRIRELRTLRGWSQGELADAVGATRQTINAIEQEKYAPSLELAFRISRSFDLGFEEVWQFS
jgi:putative transcriptional regulator